MRRSELTPRQRATGRLLVRIGCPVRACNQWGCTACVFTAHEMVTDWALEPCEVDLAEMIEERRITT